MSSAAFQKISVTTVSLFALFSWTLTAGSAFATELDAGRQAPDLRTTMDVNVSLPDPGWQAPPKGFSA